MRSKRAQSIPPWTLFGFWLYLSILSSFPVCLTSFPSVMDLQPVSWTKTFILKLFWLWCFMTAVETLTRIVSENELELLIPLLPLSQFWDYRCTQPSFVYADLGVEVKAMCILSNWCACLEAKHIILISGLFCSIGIKDSEKKPVSILINTNIFIINTKGFFLQEMFSSPCTDLLTYFAPPPYSLYKIIVSILKGFIYFYFMSLSACLHVYVPCACSTWGTK